MLQYFFEKSFQIQTDEPGNNKDIDVDINKLASWLETIYPIVKKEIDDSHNSQAFRGYRIHENNEGAAFKLLQSYNLLSRPLDIVVIRMDGKFSMYT